MSFIFFFLPLSKIRFFLLFNFFLLSHGICTTNRTHQEIQCLPYAGILYIFSFSFLTQCVELWPLNHSFLSITLGTTQQRAGPVKRVQLQLSGSNLQQTTKYRSKSPGGNKQGTRQIPQSLRWLNRKSSDLKRHQFIPRHQETWSWWQVQFPQGLEETPCKKL